MRTNSKVVVMRVDPELWEKVKDLAKKDGVPISEKAKQYLLKGMEKGSPNS